jgi:hypothetical protein
MNILRTVKKFWWVALLVIGAPVAWAFSTAGPIANGGDAWQIAALRYAQPGDIVAPKNIGEEYRRNTPVMYYACDANFLDYFGSNGVAAVDGAFAIMNTAFTNNPTGMTNGLDGYSPTLTEVPLYVKHVNYQAQALSLLDLKSLTLEELMEQMGLASPDRYVWTLHQAYLPAGTTPPSVCPEDEEFEVVQRNYDIVPSSLNQLQYSPYINDTLYTFTIFYWPNCRVPAGQTYTFTTLPVPVDPFAPVDTAVASDSLADGGFFTGLSRDDVGGLRYLMTTNNINTEDAVPGSLLLITNTLLNQHITTLPVSSLLAQSQTDSPAQLQAAFPGLVIASATPYTTTVVVTNITAYYTNQPYFAGPGTNGTTVTNFGYPPQFLVTGDLGLLLQRSATNDPATLEALYPGLLVSTVTNFGVQTVTNVLLTATNQPGPDVTNWGTYQLLNPPPNSVPPPITTGTIDFGLFTLAALTNTTGLVDDPATAIAQLQALYPGLVVVSATPNFPLTQVVTTNFVTYLYVPNGEPVGSPPLQVTYISGIFTNYEFTYSYTFGNVMLDSNGAFYPFVDYNTSRSLYGTNQTVTIQTISVTNLIGAPYGSPQSTNTTSTTVHQYGVTGDFFIEPTNWCGFLIVQPLAITANLNSYSNTVIATGTTNNLGAAQFTQNTIYTYTNRQFLIQPGVCEPVLITNITYFTTNVLTYQNTLLNVVTNSYFSNSLVAIGTTYIHTTNGAPVGTVVTNYTNPNLTNSVVNVPTGDFFIVPTNWCGYRILGTLLTNSVTTTNIVGIVAGGVGGGGGGVPFSFTTTTVTYSTNHTLAIQPGVCEPLLFFFTNVVSTDVTNYQFVFANLVTYTNAATGPTTIITTNISVVAWSNAVTLTNVVVSQTNVPGTSSGEFFILPPTWCGYVILTNQPIVTNAFYITNIFTITTNTFGITGGDQQFTTTGGGVVVPEVNSNVVYSQTIISSATNHTYLVQPQTCSTATDPARLREGIEKIQFLRANFDSLLGQFFQPITNDYTMVIVTNSQTVTEFFQRVVTTPDILLSAADTTGTLPFFTTFERGINFDEANVLPGLAGPGTINPTTTFTYNKVGDIYLNGPMSSYGITTNSFLPYLNELTQTPMLSWASFDATTNAPVVYPNGTSIQNLENEILVQVTPPPPTLPDGANGVQYSPTTPYGFVYTNSAGAVAVYTNTFTASGGSFSPPFTWSVVSGLQGQGLPSGLSLSPAGVLSGTPAGNTPGQFDFTVQLTDSLGRSVNWNYTITIDY